MERLKKIGQVKPVASKDVKFSKLGIGFEKLDRAVFDPEKAYDKVGELGIKWVRIQSGWARTEKVKGQYDFAWLDSIVDNLFERGLIPWIDLCYGNGLYDEDAAKVFGAVGYAPFRTPEQKKAWADYVSALTKRYQGKVSYYEVWNEPDGSWTWKTGPNGTEYGQFIIDTAIAIHSGDPSAKVIGGSMCLCGFEWLNDVFATGAGAYIDAFTYHSYDPGELNYNHYFPAIKAMCHAANPNIQVIQGETGCQSRSDGAGALAGGAWTPLKQAKFLTRHTMADLIRDAMFSSYFSTMDMIEALNGKVGDKASYMDYGYFGVLGADFDENGISSGEYTPKPSYYAFQTIAAIFRDDVFREDIPVRFQIEHSQRMMGNEPAPSDLMYGGFRKPNGSAAFVYWKPEQLLTSTYEGTISLQAAQLPDDVKLVDLLTGAIYELPESILQKNGRGYIKLEHLPLTDAPLLLTFGDFI